MGPLYLSTTEADRRPLNLEDLPGWADSPAGAAPAAGMDPPGPFSRREGAPAPGPWPSLAPTLAPPPAVSSLPTKARGPTPSSKASGACSRRSSERPKGRSVPSPTPNARSPSRAPYPSGSASFHERERGSGVPVGKNARRIPMRSRAGSWVLRTLTALGGCALDPPLRTPDGFLSLPPFSSRAVKCVGSSGAARGNGYRPFLQARVQP